jgi:hypothetical protein
VTVQADFRALAGQTPLRVAAKGVLSLLVIVIAAMVSREGPVLAILVIFTGVTGPTIRLATMKMEGTYDRIIVSPAAKPRFFLYFTWLWVIAVILPLMPAIAVVVILAGPWSIIPVLLGTLLAVTLGTLAGFAARGLSEAHLGAILTAGLLIPLAVIRTMVAPFLPYTAFSPVSPDPASLAIISLLPAVALVVLALAVSRT